MSIPLVQKAEKDDINTSIIAIKRNIERINMLLGLSNSEEIDTSVFATKEELEALEPVDEVAVDNMHSVTSNAVAKSLSYSTTEHATGKKWFDGKDIYSLVIINLPFVTGTRLTYNLGNNISTAWIDFTHSHVYGGYGIRQPWSESDFYVDNGVINFKTQHPSGYLCAVVEYTKSAD